jgi:hypothetical protein
LGKIMSCEIHLSAVIEDLDEVQSFFGLSGISGKKKQFSLL